jgi:hypothetical protein
MKSAEFNARIAHVHKVRNQQRAIRNKVAAISGPPTYIRQMANESIKKAQFNAMGDIIFDKTRDKSAYEKAAAHSLTITSEDGFNLDQYGERNEGLVDSPKVRDLDDDWSMTKKASTPSDPELYKDTRLSVGKKGWFQSQEDYEVEVHLEYKRRVRIKHGPNYPPFKHSTMQASHIEYETSRKTKERQKRVRQLTEIEDAIVKLSKTLTAINEQIAENEVEYQAGREELALAQQDVENARRLKQVNPTATTGTDVAYYMQRANQIKIEQDLRDALMNGDKDSPGLRNMAKEVRAGINSLQVQKRSVEGELGIDTLSTFKRVNSARVSGMKIGGGIGALAGAAGLIALAMYMGDGGPSTTRGRGRNPIDIFG